MYTKNKSMYYQMENHVAPSTYICMFYIYIYYFYLKSFWAANPYIIIYEQNVRISKILNKE